MRGVRSLFSVGLLGSIVSAGCVDHSPPPPRVAVPPPDQVRARDPEEIKPLPDQGVATDFPPPAFNDEPLVNQRTPEERAFINAYEQVGRPRILVFVNRTLEGQVIPAESDDSAPRERRRGEAGRDDTNDRYGYWHAAREDGSDARFQSQDRDQYRETTSAYLRSGHYDEGAARSLDYEAVESILTDWLGGDGRVALVSPTMAHQRLTEEQVKDLQSGRPRMLGEIARQLDADVLVQVQIHPTRQTEEGLEFRMIGEAVNLKGGESIGRAVVDVPPPLDKPRINRFTRFLARKLMDGMIGAWETDGRREPEVRRESGVRTEPDRRVEPDAERRVEPDADRRDGSVRDAAPVPAEARPAPASSGPVNPLAPNPR